MAQLDAGIRFFSRDTNTCSRPELNTHCVNVNNCFYPRGLSKRISVKIYQCIFSRSSLSLVMYAATKGVLDFIHIY
jgi:hypothetical protein